MCNSLLYYTSLCITPALSIRSPAINGLPPAINGLPPAIIGLPPAIDGLPPATDSFSSLLKTIYSRRPTLVLVDPDAPL